MGIGKLDRPSSQPTSQGNLLVSSGFERQLSVAHQRHRHIALPWGYLVETLHLPVGGHPVAQRPHARRVRSDSQKRMRNDLRRARMRHLEAASSLNQQRVAKIHSPRTGDREHLQTTGLPGGQ